MKVKLRYSYIIYCLILFIIIFDCNVFHLFKVNDNIYKAINLAVTVFAILACVINKNVLKICNEFSIYIYYYLGIILTFLLFEYMYTIRTYGNLQTIYEFAKYNKHYIFVFLTIPLFYIFIIQNNFESIMDSIAILIVISLGLILIHAFLYNWQGTELLNISKYVGKHNRNGRMRVWDLSSLEGLVIIYGFCQFLCNKKRKFFYLVQVVICIGALIYVEQTRMMLIAIAISLLFMIIIKPVKSKEEIVGKILIVIVSCIIGLLVIIPKLIDSFSRGISISYRLVEIQFIFNFLENKGILGMGMIGYNLQRYLFYRGVYANISLDDVGIIGYTAQAGIWSIGVFILPMLRMLWILLQGEKNDFKLFLWTIYIYLLVTSATLLVLDNQRILMWPFCLALFEFYNKKYNKKTYIYEENILI